MRLRTELITRHRTVSPSCMRAARWPATTSRSCEREARRRATNASSDRQPHDLHPVDDGQVGPFGDHDDAVRFARPCGSTSNAPASSRTAPARPSSTPSSGRCRRGRCERTLRVCAGGTSSGAQACRRGGRNRARRARRDRCGSRPRSQCPRGAVNGAGTLGADDVSPEGLDRQRRTVGPSGRHCPGRHRRDGVRKSPPRLDAK